MLCLLFRLGDDRFALDTAAVEAVLPLVAVTPVPLAPRGVAGLFDHRGTPVPAIDLGLFALGRPSRALRSTRIVLVRYADGRLLGLIAEQATDTLRARREDFVASGVDNPATPYLGPVLADAEGVVQLVDAQALLPPGLRDMLFQAAAERVRA